MTIGEELVQRVARLERRARTGWIAAGVIALAAVLVVSLGAARAPDDELRVKRLVVEDDEGRPRIVLAAPIARLEGRVRSDEAMGLILLDERGVDRVVVGSPTTEPQVKGAVGRRISPAHGINFCDRNGNERGGLGVLDGDSRAVLGLDSESGEGVALFVTPAYSGLIVNGTDGKRQGQVAFLGTQSSSRQTVLNFDDYDGKRRVQVTVPTGADPTLEFYDLDFEPVLTIPEPD